MATITFPDSQKFQNYNAPNLSTPGGTWVFKNLHVLNFASLSGGPGIELRGILGGYLIEF